MSTVFSEYVREAESGSEHSADQELQLRVLGEIRRVLVAELRRRGIFQAGPALLDYVGSSWNDAEAMDDLVSDCYVRAIATRIRSLRGLLLATGTIDGVVVRNIRNFVGERQRVHDPGGYAVFQNVRAAVQQLIAQGLLKPVGVEDGSEQIGGQTQLVFTGCAAAGIASDVQLGEALLRCGVSLPQLQACLTVGRQVQHGLTQTILQLSASGVTSFTMAGLKSSLCAAQAACGVARSSAGPAFPQEFFEDLAGSCRTTLAEAGYEEAEFRAYLLASLRREIDQCPRSAAVKQRLHALLDVASGGVEGSAAVDTGLLRVLNPGTGVARSTYYADLDYLRSLGQRVIHQPSGLRKDGDRNGQR